MRAAILMALVATVLGTGCSDADPAGQGGGAVDVSGSDLQGFADLDVGSNDSDAGAGDIEAQDVDPVEAETVAPADGTAGDSSPDAEVSVEPVDVPLTDTSVDAEEVSVGEEIDESDVVTDVTPTPDEGPEPPPEPTSNLMYEVGDDCVTPKDYVTAACEGVVCLAGQVCMGFGHCVPEGPFLMDPDDPGARQVKPALALALDGGYAASWYDVLYPPEVPEKSMDIGFRLFAADGTPSSEIVKLDEDALPWARSPSMTRMQGGGYLVVWRAQTGVSGDLRFLARVVDSQGVPQGNAFQLNETELVQGIGGGNVDSPVPTLLRSGDIAVTWMGSPVGSPGNKTDVYLRVLSPTGELKTGELPTGAETTVNESASVVTDTFEGGVAIFWGHNDFGPAGSNVRGRIFDKDAQPVTDIFQVSPGTDLQELMPAATTFPDGEMLLTWKSKPDSSSAVNTMSTYLGPWGEDLGSAIHHVGTDPLGNYPFYSPTDEADPERAAVVWHTIDEALDGVYMRRYYPLEDMYDCETTELSGPLMPNEYGNRHLPAVLGFPDGRFLAVWSASFDNGQTVSRAVLRYVK